MLTKARMRGVVAGAFVLTLFGSFWSIVTLVFWQAHPAWAIPLAAFVTVLMFAVCLMRWRASTGLLSNDDPPEAAKGKRAGMLGIAVFWIEAGLIGLVSALFGRSGHGEWIPVAIALIVGLHFLPLARIFQAPVYYWTGGASVLGVLLCLPIRTTGLRLLCVGGVMTAVLWTTAALLLRETSPSHA